MRFSRMLKVIDAHAEGESGKVVVGGVGSVPGHIDGSMIPHIRLQPSVASGAELQLIGTRP